MVQRRLVVIALLGLIFTASISADSIERHIQLLSRDTGWFLGQGKLYWTADNGVHWTNVTPPMSLPWEKIADVHFRNAQEGAVLLSTNENAGPEAQFMVASTVDSGRDWVITSVHVPGPGVPKRPLLYGAGDIFFLDSLHGWLNLDLESGPAFNLALLVSTDDGGNSWNLKSSPGAGAIRFVTPNRGWIAGGPGGPTLYSTTDGGVNWDQVSLQYGQLKSIGEQFTLPNFADQQHGSLIVTLPHEGAIVLFATSDGGRSWLLMTAVHNPTIKKYGEALASTVADSAWLIAESANSSISLTTAQFTEAASPPETRTAEIAKSPFPTFASDVSFATPDDGWVLAGRLYATTDGGRSWKDISPWPAPEFRTAHVPSSEP